MRFLLLLVRHGQTRANRKGILLGHSDEALSDKGIAESKRCARHLAHVDPTYVFTSDLQRAVQTVDIILEDKSHGPVIFDGRLRERDYGHFEGQKAKELAKVARENNLTMSEYTPEGAESRDQVKDRVIGCFQAICRKVVQDQGKETRSVLIISHGGPLRELINYFVEKGCKLPDDRGRLTRPPANASVWPFWVSLTDSKEAEVVFDESTFLIK